MTSNIISKPIQEAPVAYNMRLFEAESTDSFSLVFRSACTMWNRYGGMDGYTYSFNGRTYRDVDSLWEAPVEKLAEKVSIGTDKYGEKVLKTYESIPTFDSCDREWNSKQMRFLFFDGKEIHLVVMDGGYRIAQLTFYETLLSADAGMKLIFGKLGWPMDGIVWT